MKGLCVIKKAISQVRSEDLKEKLNDLISKNTVVLVHNPYGNYTIQIALDVINK